MLELHVDKEIADALWGSSRDSQPAVLTFCHDGRLIAFHLGVRSAEISQHGPTMWRHGKPYTVALELVQLIDKQP